MGLLLSGVLIGPHVLGHLGETTPIADFFSDLGKLLLMFFAGLEIDLALFRQAQRRAITSASSPPQSPDCWARLLGYGSDTTPSQLWSWVHCSPRIRSWVCRSINRLGLTRLEPIIVTVGATVMSDTLSLIVFAICASTYKSGFSVSTLAVQLIEIAVFVPLILFGVSRLGAYILKKVENDENAYFIVMLAILAVAGVLADSINLPGIVGAFLAGLAVNSAVRDNPAKEKLEFFRKFLLYPDFLYRHGVPDRPDGVRSQHH